MGDQGWCMDDIRESMKECENNKNVGVIKRRQLPDVEQALLSIIEPKNFIEASKNDEWVKSMNEELDQIEKMRPENLS